ncbi:hypothetical protein PVAND_009251 [Polypedilum vanderplanki]|uniref:Uncharacterized protein n=1 Tax=Polypedilum vanderplanki TaxID=319348 RepID=A0A9J6CCQ0_POLVA|nr:hypothetical protein PVAND_009251 [Polypedilum vanderplanki]
MTFKVLKQSRLVNLPKMKFLLFVVTIFAIIFAVFADCPTGLCVIDGVCGIPRTVNSNCPSNTKYDVNKGFCVLK